MYIDSGKIKAQKRWSIDFYSFSGCFQVASSPVPPLRPLSETCGLLFLRSCLDQNWLHTGNGLLPTNFDETVAFLFHLFGDEINVHRLTSKRISKVSSSTFNTMENPKNANCPSPTGLPLGPHPTTCRRPQQGFGDIAKQGIGKDLPGIYMFPVSTVALQKIGCCRILLKITTKRLSCATKNMRYCFGTMKNYVADVGG